MSDTYLLMIRVLLVEDQTLMRQGLRTILDPEPSFEVVGEASDGQEAVGQALALRPDLVLMDVQMPRMKGVEATRQITALVPHVQVVILTTFDYDEYVFDGIKAGAHGYLLTCPPGNHQQRCGGCMQAKASSSPASLRA